MSEKCAACWYFGQIAARVGTGTANIRRFGLYVKEFGGFIFVSAGYALTCGYEK